MYDSQSYQLFNKVVNVPASIALHVAGDEAPGIEKSTFGCRVLITKFSVSVL